MFYERIVISGCTRFSVSGRYYMDIRPTAKVQMILGTNGSGKTTLAHLGFSPLPINPKWMRKGGYFIKEGTYKGNRYYLEGQYGDKPKFTFKKNDEVLLDEGNVSTYNDLVKVHLDYTPWLHQVITGKFQFTELGPQQRQDFLSKISNSDFTHAFKMLASYKKMVSHYGSVVSFLQGRINEEKVRLLDDEAVIEHKTLAESIQQEITELHAIPSYEHKRGDITTSRESLINDLHTYLTSPPASPTHDTEEALLSENRKLEDSLLIIQIKLDELNKEYDQYKQQLHLLETDEVATPEMVKELSDIRSALNALEVDHLQIPREYYSPNSDDVTQLIMIALGSLSHDPLDQALEMNLRLISQNKSLELDRIQNRLDEIQSQLGYFNNIQVVECPSCHHQFKPGVDQQQIDDLLRKEAKGYELIKRAKDELQSSNESLTEYMERKELYDQLHRIRQEYGQKYPGLFIYIDSLGGFGKGRELISHIRNYQIFCQRTHQKEHLTARVERLSVLVSKIDEHEQERQRLSTTIPDLEKQISDYVHQMRELKDAIRRNRDSLATVTDDEVRCREVLGNVEQFLEVLDGELEHLKQQMKKEALDSALGRLATIHKTITDQNTVKSLIDDFEQQLTSAKKKHWLSKEIVEALSPKNGLIAEQLSLSVGNFLDGLNQLLEKVWGYPLEIRMGQVGDNGLDYKFPISDSEVERDDVSEGSDSMLEMVNRAVTMMTYFSLDLTDLPLFLDEPGRTFDKVHQINLIPLIRDLSDSVRFSQILLISHNEDVQTAFPNSETIILDDRNINYPHPYNEHVQFEP